MNCSSLWQGGRPDKIYNKTVDTVKLIRTTKTQINYLIEKANENQFMYNGDSSLFEVESNSIYTNKCSKYIKFDNLGNSIKKQKCNGNLIRNKQGTCMTLLSKIGEEVKIKIGKTDYYCDYCAVDQSNNLKCEKKSETRTIPNPERVLERLNENQEWIEESGSKNYCNKLKLLKEILESMFVMFTSDKIGNINHRANRKRSISGTLWKVFNRNITELETEKVNLIMEKIDDSFLFIRTMPQVLHSLTNFKNIDEITQSLEKSVYANNTLFHDLDEILTKDNITKLVMFGKNIDIKFEKIEYMFHENDTRIEAIIPDKEIKLNKRNRRLIGELYSIPHFHNRKDITI